MNPRLNRLLQEWALRDWGDEEQIFLSHDVIQYFGRKVYGDYEPSQFEQFEDRLDRWLHNVQDNDDQQALFKLLNHLFFIGRAEFESLCRAAYHGPVFRWLVDLNDVDISDPNNLSLLEEEVSNTWFCPITDSMRINSFLKVNRLSGKSHRPDWRSLTKFGDPTKVLAYIAANNIKRVVLLEDFVGSGTQMRSAVRFAANLSQTLPVLALPLVVCPDGDDLGRALANEFAHVSYEPVMTISPGLFIKAEPQPNDPIFYSQIRDLILKVRGRLNQPAPDTESQKYHGFKNTGAVISLYSNCPNNSLPIIYDETEHWSALFPRIERV